VQINQPTPRCEGIHKLLSESTHDHIWEERLGIHGKDTRKYHLYSYQGPPETIEDPMGAPQRPRPHAY